MQKKRLGSSVIEIRGGRLCLVSMFIILDNTEWVSRYGEDISVRDMCLELIGEEQSNMNPLVGIYTHNVRLLNKYLFEINTYYTICKHNKLFLIVNFKTVLMLCP